MSSHTVTIDTSNYIIESPVKGAPLTLADKTARARFELGVCMAIYGWDDLQTAVTAQWGGPESGEKRDWLVGSVVDMFAEASYLEAEDIEDRLLGVMEDEFGTSIEDDSGLPVAAQVIAIYKECAKGDFTTVDALYQAYQTREEQKKAGLITTKKVKVEGDDESDCSSDEENDNDEDVPALKEDVEMEEAEPQGPVIDDDGFELVQKKGKGRRR
jgi:pre-rRNA-processing protein TSR2